jgi:hypothetical protein
MKLQGRQLEGSIYTATDKFEFVLTGAPSPLAVVLHSIEVVSGPTVTHGGGALVGEFLHYKSIERHLEADGYINYGSVDVLIEQQSKGDTVFKGVASVISSTDSEANAAASSAWANTMAAAGVSDDFPRGTDGNFDWSAAPVFIEPTIVKTENLTCTWRDSVLV